MSRYVFEQLPGRSGLLVAALVALGVGLAVAGALVGLVNWVETW